jgi:hypothetical protein
VVLVVLLGGIIGGERGKGLSVMFWFMMFEVGWFGVMNVVGWRGGGFIM